jgi:hypothetical protein
VEKGSSNKPKTSKKDKKLIVKTSENTKAVYKISK